MKLTKLILKNFRIIARSRISSLIIIFGPLLIMLLAGFAFDNNASFDLNVGIFVPEQSNLTIDFTNSLSKQFKLFTYTNNSDCIADVRNLKLHSCLVFSSDFTITDGKKNNITIVVDNSKVNIVDLIQNALNKVIATQSVQIGSDLAGVLILRINDASVSMNEWQAKDLAGILATRNGLEASIETDEKKWSALNLGYTDKGPIVSDVVKKQQKESNISAELVTAAYSAADIAQDLADDVQSSNATSDIKALATATELKVTDARDTISQYANDSISSNKALVTSINDLTKLIDEMAGKISQTGTLKADLLKRFEAYKQQLVVLSTQVEALSGKMTVESDKLKNIKIKDASTIVSPIDTKIEPVVASFSKLNYIFPSLMMLVIMFVTVMLSATIVVIEKLSPAKFRLFTTPTSDIVFITSNFLTTLLVATFQIILMILIAAYVFHLDVLTNIANTSAILFLGAIIFTLVGMCLGYIFANEQTTILGAISIGSAFILVSDLILPLESISLELRNVISHTPFVILTGLLRRTILFGANIKSLGTDFYLIILYCVSLFAVIVIAHKLLKILYLVGNTKKAKKKA